MRGEGLGRRRLDRVANLFDRHHERPQFRVGRAARCPTADELGAQFVQQPATQLGAERLVDDPTRGDLRLDHAGHERGHQVGNRRRHGRAGGLATPPFRNVLRGGLENWRPTRDPSRAVAPGPCMRQNRSDRRDRGDWLNRHPAFG